MNVIDIILGIFLIIGLVKGLQRGFIIELSSVVALVASIYGALNYSHFAEHYLREYFDWSENSIEIFGFFISFIAILIAVSILGKILTKIVNTVALGALNRLLGGIFGVVKSGLIIIVLLMVFNFLNGDSRFIDRKKIESSHIVGFISEITPWFLPTLETFIDENIEQSDMLM